MTNLNRNMPWINSTKSSGHKLIQRQFRFFYSFLTLLKHDSFLAPLMQDQDFRNTRQRISLNTQKHDLYTDKKQARIELRGLKDVLPLKTTTDSQIHNDIPEGVTLKRITAYCIADRINLKNLYRNLYEDEKILKNVMYFGECLYNSVLLDGESEEVFDIFYFDYGVIVTWGLQESSEAQILKTLYPFLEGRYEINNYEVESFSYGIVSENARVLNDVIYLNTEFYFNKMVISNAIAQSLKLDYFENIVEMTIESVKDLPLCVEKEGKVAKSRKEVLKLIGKLHRLKFNLNLISNILDEPEILWHHPEHQSLYQSLNHYLEIKPRVAVLNLRCDIIHGILDILSKNISTSNSERFELIMVILVVFILVLGIYQVFFKK